MKKLKIGMVALMAAGSMAWAQNAASQQTQSAPEQNQQSSKTPEERAAAHSQKLTGKLGLTADQQKSVYGFCLQRAQQEDADRAKFQGDRGAMKGARQQNEQNFENNLYTGLSADQKTKYEQMKQEQKEKRQEKWGNNNQ